MKVIASKQKDGTYDIRCLDFDILVKGAPSLPAGAEFLKDGIKNYFVAALKGDISTLTEALNNRASFRFYALYYWTKLFGKVVKNVKTVRL